MAKHHLTGTSWIPAFAGITRKALTLSSFRGRRRGDFMGVLLGRFQIDDSSGSFFAVYLQYSYGA
jgi:hypothetical protein